jgi:predicted translin family RNA/ssDNA-binding protein
MLNQKFFQELKKQHDLYREERQDIIFKSGEAIHKAKQAIFAFHRDDMKGGNELIAEVEAIFNDLEKNFKKDDSLRAEGSYRAAIEEYIEAKFFGRVLQGEKIDAISEVPKIDYESYIGGICDLTGEIVRKAVLRVTEGKAEEAGKLGDALREIMTELIKFDLTSYLRTKYDQAKNNLRRMEEILYDINIRKKS